jgi:hypothetical protein
MIKNKYDITNEKKKKKKKKKKTDKEMICHHPFHFKRVI